MRHTATFLKRDFQQLIDLLTRLEHGVQVTFDERDAQLLTDLPKEVKESLEDEMREDELTRIISQEQSSRLHSIKFRKQKLEEAFLVKSELTQKYGQIYFEGGQLKCLPDFKEQIIDDVKKIKKRIYFAN